MNNLEIPAETAPEFTSTNETSLVVIIVDSNPSQKMLRYNPHALTHCVDSVIAFANSHLMQKAQNKLAVMACHSKARYKQFWGNSCLSNLSANLSILAPTSP